MRIAIAYARTTGRSCRRSRSLLLVAVRRVEVRGVGVGVQGEPEESDRQQCGPVERDEHALARRFTQGLADEPGGKRQERHREQQQQVESQEDRIGAGEPIGQRRVAEPRGADRQEADEVRDERRPDVQHLVQRRTGWMNREVQHQQRDGDREHAVAERLQPPLTERARRPGVDSSGRKASSTS